MNDGESEDRRESGDDLLERLAEVARHVDRTVGHAGEKRPGSVRIAGNRTRCGQDRFG